VHRSVVSSPSIQTTNCPWKGRDYVTHFKFGGLINISGMAEARAVKFCTYQLNWLLVPLPCWLQTSGLCVMAGQAKSSKLMTEDGVRGLRPVNNADDGLPTSHIGRCSINSWVVVPRVSLTYLRNSGNVHAAWRSRSTANIRPTCVYGR